MYIYIYIYIYICIYVYIYTYTHTHTHTHIHETRVPRSQLTSLHYRVLSSEIMERFRCQLMTTSECASFCLPRSSDRRNTRRFDQFGARRRFAYVIHHFISSVITATAAAAVMMRHFAQPRRRFCATQNSRSIANNLRAARDARQWRITNFRQINGPIDADPYPGNRYLWLRAPAQMNKASRVYHPARSDLVIKTGRNA